MTENYAVDNTRSHGTSGFLLGAGAGALGSLGVAKYKPEWIPKKEILYTQQYKSIDDIIKEKKDTFVNSAAKEGISAEEKEAWESLKSAKEDITAKLKELSKIGEAKFDSKVAAEGQAVKDAACNLKTKYQDVLLKLMAGEVEGFEPTATTAEEIEKEAKKFIKDNIDTKAELAEIKQGRDNIKEAIKKLADKASKEGVGAHREMDAEALKSAKDTVWENCKDAAKQIKGVNKTRLIIAGAAILGVVGGLIGSLVKTKAE